MANEAIPGLLDKITIHAELELKSGLHIGGAKEFSSIGMVDLVIARDGASKEPIIPGSSLKGKLRTLLARLEKGFGFLEDHKRDPEMILRLFGSSEPVRFSRLQFQDAKLSADSKERLGKRDLDLYLAEIKFENTINRLNSQANPRQLERVPAGARFKVALTYNVENLDETADDLSLLAKGLMLLQHDYLGGHGSRGYGRVAWQGITLKRLGLSTRLSAEQTSLLDQITAEAQRRFDEVSDAVAV